jgi:hypothetical protein
MSHYTIRYQDKDGDGFTEVKRRKAGPALATASDAQQVGKVNIIILDYDEVPITVEDLAARIANEKGK